MEKRISRDSRSYVAPGKWLSRNGSYGMDAFYGRPEVQPELTEYDRMSVSEREAAHYTLTPSKRIGVPPIPAKPIIRKD